MMETTRSSTTVSGFLFTSSVILLLLVPQHAIASSSSSSLPDDVVTARRTGILQQQQQQGFNETTTIQNNNNNNNNNNNSNNGNDAIYDILQVQPPTPCHSILGRTVKRWSWKWHARLLPLLHYGFADTYVNLRVLWNKALISLDPNIITTTTTSRKSSLPFINKSNNNQVGVTRSCVSAYAVLPRYSRWLLYVFRPWFPRWMHANIELRVVYLHLAIQKELERYNRSSADVNKDTTLSLPVVKGSSSANTTTSPTTPMTTNKTAERKNRIIRLLTIGGGYDTRSLELLERGEIDEAWELDLPKVVAGKERLLTQWSKRQKDKTAAKDLLRRLFLRGVDLNDLDQVREVLDDVFAQKKNDNDGENSDSSTMTKTILVSEAVILYLNKPIVAPLMRLLAAHCDSLCFADRFPTSNGSNGMGEDENSKDALRVWLATNGWDLVEFLPKPGATRQLGIARRSVG